MTLLFAPPELLSAYAFANDGSDADLAPRTHLRLFAGLGPSFPLTPFAVFKIASRSAEPRRVVVMDRERQVVPGFDLSQIGEGEATLLLTDTDDRRTVRVELDDPEGRVERVTLLGPRGTRPIAARDAPRWLFSAPRMQRLIARGSSTHVSIRTRSVDIADILEQGEQSATVLGLPVEGRHRWYVGSQNRDDGLRRAERGAPQRLNPMDRPDGPFDPVSPSDEVRRVEAMLQLSDFGGGLEQLLATLADDAERPWQQTELQQMLAQNGKKQFARAPRLGTLQMAVTDPGLARFFGFADLMDDMPDIDGQGGWDTLAIVGLFALEPKDFEQRGVHLASLLFQQAPGAGKLLDMLVRALNHASGQDQRADVDDIIQRVRSAGLMAAPFVAVVSPVPPWLPPELPGPQITEHRWQAATGNAPSALYRASFAFPQPPLAGMASLATLLDGTWVSRHETVAERAKPRAFGHERSSAGRLRKSLQPAAAFEPAGLLSDQDIDAEAGPVSYRAQASDFFGRFGSPDEFAVQPPPRPAPPPPVMRYHLERAAIDPLAPGSLSPGVLKLTVAVPHPAPADRFTADEEKRLGPAIVTPRIDDLAGGALEVVKLTVRLAGGAPHDVDLTAPGFFDMELLLPALAPQEKQSWTLTGVFTDTAGARSDAPGVNQDAASLLVEVTDVRPPRAYPTGIGLFWTSAPGPAPEVELKLTWPAPAGSRHRIYLTDQQGLGLTPPEVAEAQPGAAPSRGRVAAVGGHKVLDNGHVDRKVFRLLTEQPIQAGPDGAVLDARLPRSLATVQFLRIVPLGPDGGEPPFDGCGIVPVAVPDSRRPEAPRLEAPRLEREVDPATGTAQLRIVTDGFDRVALERDEPGLFTAGAQGSEPPQFRIRRAVGAVADPIYARTVGGGPLQVEDAAASPALFAGAYTDDQGGQGLEPFVRYVYWAEVRLPPERRLPANFLPLDPPGGVTVLDPANAQSHPRPISLPSAPRVLMHMPADPPAPPPDAAITITRAPANPAGEVMLTIQIAEPPHAHHLAIGPYRLAAWLQWAGKAIQPMDNANGAALNGVWPELSAAAVTTSVTPPENVDPASALTLRLAFVDPASRLGAPATVEV
jgi:hypothetical protein